VNLVSSLGPAVEVGAGGWGRQRERLGNGIVSVCSLLA